MTTGDTAAAGGTGTVDATATAGPTTTAGADLTDGATPPTAGPTATAGACAGAPPRATATASPGRCRLGRRHRAGRGGDAGSILILFPAAVLVVVLLGAVAIDSAVVFLRQREAINVATDAANDAAGAGIDLDVARRTGQFVYDPALVAAVARRTVDLHDLAGTTLESVTTDGDDVIVTLRVEVEPLLGRAFGRDDQILVVTAHARGVTFRP